MAEKDKAVELSVHVPELPKLTRMANTGSSCRLAGFLVREDDDALYIADPHGTWVLPHDSYESFGEWTGGAGAPESLLASGRPVQVVLREGALIHELRPWRIRKGGDPIDAKLRREAIKRVFSLDGGDLPTTEKTAIGEQQLAMLEEVVGRRLGWDPGVEINAQSFAGHHPRGASWNCGSDGGGS